jgi:hypothetical protein
MGVHPPHCHPDKSTIFASSEIKPEQHPEPGSTSAEYRHQDAPGFEGWEGGTRETTDAQYIGTQTYEKICPPPSSPTLSPPHEARQCGDGALPDRAMGADLWGGVKGADERGGPGDVQQGRAGREGRDEGRVEGGELRGRPAQRSRGRPAQRSRDVKRGPGDLFHMCMYVLCV